MAEKVYFRQNHGHSAQNWELWTGKHADSAVPQV